MIENPDQFIPDFADARGELRYRNTRKLAAI